MINNNMDICQLFSNVYITNCYIARSQSQWDILFLRSCSASAKCSIVLIEASTTFKESIKMAKISYYHNK